MAEKQTFIDVKVPGQCVAPSEKTVTLCGVPIKRWCLLLAGFVITTAVFFVLFLVYVVGLGTATSCRLTYSDYAIISESEMQTLASQDNWTLKVPSYDPWRRTCVCKGYEDIHPITLQPNDKVLAWIAPGDLVSLFAEGEIDKMPLSFVETYKDQYAEEDHVKVCMPQKNLVDLWNNNDAEGRGGGPHCHMTTGDASNTVKSFLLGWDVALFCARSCQQRCDDYADEKGQNNGNCDKTVCEGHIIGCTWNSHLTMSKCQTSDNAGQGGLW